MELFLLNLERDPFEVEQPLLLVASASVGGRLRLVASGDAAEGSVALHADARLYAGLFDGAEAAELVLPPGRQVYVHLVRGSLTVNGHVLTAGDALQGTPAKNAEVGHDSHLALDAGLDAEVLVFDLAA